MKNKSKDTSKWKCRVCGCTDTTPCPGGCAWVEKNLCSVCEEREKHGMKVVSETPEIIVVKIPPPVSLVKQNPYRDQLCETPQLLKIFPDHLEMTVEMPVFQIQESAPKPVGPPGKEILKQMEPHLEFSGKKEKQVRNLYFHDWLNQGKVIHSIEHGTKLVIFEIKPKREKKMPAVKLPRYPCNEGKAPADCGHCDADPCPYPIATLPAKLPPKIEEKLIQKAAEIKRRGRPPKEKTT